MKKEILSKLLKAFKTAKDVSAVNGLKEIMVPFRETDLTIEALEEFELALDVLKESVSPVLSPSHLWETYSQTRHGECPKCGADINEYDNSKCCGRCGQAVKW